MSNLTDPPQFIDLDPIDWHWATWRERQPLPRPIPPPFDRAEAEQKVIDYLVETIPFQSPNQRQSKLKLSAALSTEEAHFWFAALTATTVIGASALYTKLQRTPFTTLDNMDRTVREQIEQDLKVALTEQSFTGQITLDEARTRLAMCNLLIRPEIMIPLSHLFKAEELIGLLAEGEKFSLDFVIKNSDQLISVWGHPWLDPEVLRENLLHTLITGFITYVLPYLAKTEIEALQPHLRPYVTPAAWPLDHYNRPSHLFHLAARLGMHEEMRAVVRSWPDDFYKALPVLVDWHHRPQEIVFGLGSAELVAAELRRLALPLRNPTHVRAWLAHTEFGALEVIRDNILALTDKLHATKLVEILALVHAPEAAPHMLALMHASKAHEVARRWLDQHPHFAAAGLLPLVAGRGQSAEAALHFLHRMRAKGHEALIQTYLEALPAGEAASVRAKLLPPDSDAPIFDAATTPDWLAALLPQSKGAGRVKLPAWANPRILPAVMIGERRLNDDQVISLLVRLKQSGLEPPPPWVAELKVQAQLASLETFGWRLFQLWQQDGAPSQDRWCLTAVGLLGGNAAAIDLAKHIREWPGQAQHQRAVAGLACLQAIGTDTALMQLNDIAHKVKFKALKAKAQEAIEVIARDRNLSREQLEDRIVPDCGLNERGSRRFDFGPRQFYFSLGPDLKPVVRDAAGKLLPNLPKPGPKDNPTLAAQARADWELLKKQMRQILKTQAERLHRAFVTGRRWSPAEFETLLVQHPLMINLARLLLWGGYDEGGALVVVFRLTEDQTCADVEDETITLEEGIEIGLVHPLELSEADRMAWAELFSDYELAPPFPQLGRDIYDLRQDEITATEITRFAGKQVAAIVLTKLLEGRGWQRGEIGPTSWTFHAHIKPFVRAGLTAKIEYDGIYADLYHAPHTTLHRCYVVPGLFDAAASVHFEAALPLGQVNPVVISELLRDLTILTDKER